MNLWLYAEQMTSESSTGLSPDLQSMEQIRRIMRPTDVPDTGKSAHTHTHTHQRKLMDEVVNNDNACIS